MPNVRPREARDLLGCVELLRAVHDADRYPVNMPEDPRRFLEVSGTLGAWVAEVDGVLAGHVLLRRATSPGVMALASAATGLGEDALAVVGRLLVAPWARRRGVGAALLDAAAGNARAQGRHPVLDVVVDDGTGGGHVAAVALYDGAGWRRVGEVTVTFANGRTVDELVYVAPGCGHSRADTHHGAPADDA